MRRTVWLLRVALPMAAVSVAMSCGLTFSGACGAVLGSCFAMLVIAFNPIFPLDFGFSLIFRLYGIRMSQAEGPLKIDDPDVRFGLLLAIPLALVIVGWFALAVAV